MIWLRSMHSIRLLTVSLNESPDRYSPGEDVHKIHKRKKQARRHLLLLWFWKSLNHCLINSGSEIFIGNNKTLQGE